jgi:hypothetical protein
MAATAESEELAVANDRVSVDIEAHAFAAELNDDDHDDDDDHHDDHEADTKTVGAKTETKSVAFHSATVATAVAPTGKPAVATAAPFAIAARATRAAPVTTAAPQKQVVVAAAATAAPTIAPAVAAVAALSLSKDLKPLGAVAAQALADALKQRAAVTPTDQDEVCRRFSSPYTCLPCVVD